MNSEYYEKIDGRFMLKVNKIKIINKKKMIKKSSR